MSKDPAALVYIDKWYTATSDLQAKARAWYWDLIMFQFQKGSLPNELEELASIARVRFSEFEEFKQTYEQVLKQKFKQNESGRLENDVAKEIISKRNTYKDKRSKAGVMGVFIKMAESKFDATPDQIEFIKKELNKEDYENIDKHMREQKLKQMLELYINVDVNVNEKESLNEKEGLGEKPDLSKKSKINPQKVVDLFHQFCSELPKVMVLSKARKSAISSRINEHGLNSITQVFQMTGASKFMNGDNKEGWRATFDWVMKPTNFVKILEGNYQNRSSIKSQINSNEPTINRQTADTIKSNFKGW